MQENTNACVSVDNVGKVCTRVTVQSKRWARKKTTIERKPLISPRFQIKPGINDQPNNISAVCLEPGLNF